MAARVNMWFVASGAFSMLAAFSGLVGLVIQQRSDMQKDATLQAFHAKQNAYVDEERLKDRPSVAVSGCGAGTMDTPLVLTITNHGKQPADRVYIHTISHPVELAKSLTQSFGPLLNGQSLTLNYDKFGGVRLQPMVNLLSDVDKQTISEISTGRRGLVVEIRLDYKLGDSVYSSPVYSLIWWAPNNCAFSLVKE